jgi:hypothetical protein
MLTKVFGAYGSSMGALGPTFKHWLLSPSTCQGGCHKQFKIGFEELVQQAHNFMSFFVYKFKMTKIA